MQFISEDIFGVMVGFFGGKDFAQLASVCKMFAAFAKGAAVRFVCLKWSPAGKASLKVGFPEDKIGIYERTRGNTFYDQFVDFYSAEHDGVLGKQLQLTLECKYKAPIVNRVLLEYRMFVSLHFSVFSGKYLPERGVVRVTKRTFKFAVGEKLLETEVNSIKYGSEMKSEGNTFMNKGFCESDEKALVIIDEMDSLFRGVFNHEISFRSLAESPREYLLNWFEGRF